MYLFREVTPYLRYMGWHGHDYMKEVTISQRYKWMQLHVNNLEAQHVELKLMHHGFKVIRENYEELFNPRT
jgi:hypothetical protein